MAFGPVTIRGESSVIDTRITNKSCPSVMSIKKGKMPRTTVSRRLICSLGPCVSRGGLRSTMKLGCARRSLSNRVCTMRSRVRDHNL